MENLKQFSEINFGTVFVNTNSRRVIQVANKTSISQVFKVERDLKTWKIDNGFKIKPAISPLIKPGGVFDFTVYFTPKVLNVKSCALFTINHDFGTEGSFYLVADVKGPKCSLSCKELHMLCPPDKKVYSKKFELRNGGSCSTIFQFILDSRHSRINLQPLEGTILPESSVSITASYSAIDSKLYFKKIFCLIDYHEPIVLDVYAKKLKSNEKFAFDIIKDGLPKYRNGYLSFLNGVTEQVTESGFISLDKFNIDFGSCWPKTLKKSDFSITNNYSQNILVKWNDKPSTNTFTVCPVQSELAVGCSATFSATFYPPAKDLLYGAWLEAQLLVDSHVVPFNVDINLKGHSFDDLSCGWAAQYRVKPNCVLLPPCAIHQLPSHCTLAIHRQAHLPLGFRFHPPALTNFTVKPQQGVIYGKFQIVVVQFNPNKLNEAIYTERWLLGFNSNEDVHQCFVEFQASVEIPEVIINAGKDIVFPSVHPGTCYNLPVDLHNPTRFSFHYSLHVIIGEPILWAGTEGHLRPYEHQNTTLRFCPKGVGQLHGLVRCKPLLGDSEASKVTDAIVTADCTETQLQVIPHGLLYEEVLRGVSHERGFELINSEDAAVQATLTWLPSEICQPDDLILRTDPDQINLKPGESVLVNVTVTPLVCGRINLCIGYSTGGSTSTPLLPVFINSVFPCLKVTDLRITNGGPLFAKYHFWKAMQIDKLNGILSGLKQGENPNIEMRLPSFLTTTPDITVEMMVENVSEVAANLKLTRQAMCGCRPEYTRISFSRSQWIDKCPHKHQVKVTPTSADVKPNSHIVFNVLVSYASVGSVECQHLVTLTPEDYAEVTCMLRLFIGRTSIPEDTTHVDSLEPLENDSFVFTFRPVFIGDCYPVAQAFTLYNNSKHSVSYEVDDSTLHETPFKYISKRNLISPISNHSLLFTFLPHRCEMYEVQLKLIINNVPWKLVLRGTGSVASVDEAYKEVMLPETDKLSLLYPVPVSLSRSHIHVGPAHQFSNHRHIFFINNQTTEVMSFKWNITRVMLAVECRVHPNKGAITPGNSVACRVVCYHKGVACRLTTILTCVFASFTKYSQMVQTTNKYRDDLAMSTNYFIITERGHENIELLPPADQWPRKNYLTLSLTVDVRDSSSGATAMLPQWPATYAYVMAPRHFSTLFPHSPFSSAITIMNMHHSPSSCNSLGTLHSTACLDQNESALEITNEMRIIIAYTLERLLWECLDELQESGCESARATRYCQLAPRGSSPVPRQLLQTALEDVLFSAWESVCQLTQRRCSEHLRRTLLTQLHQHRTGRYSPDYEGSLFKEQLASHKNSDSSSFPVP